MLKNKSMEYIDQFSVDYLVNKDFLSHFLFSDKQLKEKLNNDIPFPNIDYRTFISYYNPNIDFNNLPLSNEGNMMNVKNILDEINWEGADKVSKYYKNLCDLLTLKHLLTVIDKTKNEIISKISSYKSQAELDDNQLNSPNKYNKLLSRNVDQLFCNLTYEAENVNSIPQINQRPQTAHGRVKANENTFVSFKKQKSETSTERESQINSNNSLFKPTCDQDLGHAMNINLTSVVWPKSRTLLSIVSKMHNEKFINSEQRTVLKEMIIDRDQTLIKFLNEYEYCGDSKTMYQKIIKLSMERIRR